MYNIGIVLPAIPGYSETFIYNKINGLLDNGFKVILFVWDANVIKHSTGGRFSLETSSKNDHFFDKKSLKSDGGFARIEFFAVSEKIPKLPQKVIQNGAQIDPKSIPDGSRKRTRK